MPRNIPEIYSPRTFLINIKKLVKINEIIHILSCFLSLNADDDKYVNRASQKFLKKKKILVSFCSNTCKLFPRTLDYFLIMCMPFSKEFMLLLTIFYDMYVNKENCNNLLNLQIHYFFTMRLRKIPKYNDYDKKWSSTLPILS